MAYSHRAARWLVPLGFLVAAPACNHFIPVVEHASYVRLPANRALLDSDSLVHDWEMRHRLARGNVRTRAGRNTATCNPCTIQVRITAVEGAKYADPEHSPSQTQLLAWIENLDTLNADSVYGFKPTRAAIYAVISDPAPGHPALRILEIPRGTRGGIFDKTRGVLSTCHSYDQPLYSEADFRACDPAMHEWAGGFRNVARSFLSAISRSSTMLAGDPTWFTCNTGCCSGSSMTAVIM